MEREMTSSGTIVLKDGCSPFRFLYSFVTLGARFSSYTLNGGVISS